MSISKIFKALSNDQRLELFMMIYNDCCSSGDSCEGGGCCCDGQMDKAFTKACDCMNLSRSTISHHMKELQNAGLIECTRDGQSQTCTVNQDAVNEIRGFLN